MYDPVTFGRRLRRLRLWRRLTLDQLADRCGLTKGFLSRVENGKTSMSAQSLAVVAPALGLRAPQLMIADEVAPVVQPAMTIPGELRRGDDGLRSLLIASGRADATMSPAIREARRDDIDPRAAPVMAEAEIYIYVISGQLRVEVGDLVYELAVGDSILFEGATPHRLRPITDSARWLDVRSSPPEHRMMIGAPAPKAAKPTRKRKRKSPSPTPNPPSPPPAEPADETPDDPAPRQPVDPLADRWAALRRKHSPDGGQDATD